MIAKEVVMSYIEAMEQQRYEDALKHISEDAVIIGPAGESFGGPRGFIDMMRNFPGKYEIKRLFVGGDEVCLLYDFVMEKARVYMSSWYKVEGGKLTYIRTIFDPSAFGVPGTKK